MNKPISSIEDCQFKKADGSLAWNWGDTDAKRCMALVALCEPREPTWPRGVESIAMRESFERDCYLFKVRHPALEQVQFHQPIEIIELDELIYRVGQWEKRMAYPDYIHFKNVWRNPLPEEFGNIGIECWHWFAGRWLWANMGSDEAKSKHVLVRVDPTLKTVNQHRAKSGLVPLPDERGEQVVTPNGVD